MPVGLGCEGLTRKSWCSDRCDKPVIMILVQAVTTTVLWDQLSAKVSVSTRLALPPISLCARWPCISHQASVRSS